jgi:hypothetical protein
MLSLVKPNVTTPSIRHDGVTTFVTTCLSKNLGKMQFVTTSRPVQGGAPPSSSSSRTLRLRGGLLRPLLRLQPAFHPAFTGLVAAVAGRTPGSHTGQTVRRGSCDRFLAFVLGRSGSWVIPYRFNRNSRIKSRKCTNLHPTPPIPQRSPAKVSFLNIKPRWIDSQG